MSQKYSKTAVKKLKTDYIASKDKIIQRLDEFAKIWESRDDRNIFAEMIFCLLTPQSKAVACWQSVEEIFKNDDLSNLEQDSILKCLTGVRFKYTKSKRIIDAIEKFYSRNSIVEILQRFDDPYLAREWFVENVNGFGYKEASHFLRNIGWGKNIAILDRHILKTLFAIAIIDEIPRSMNRKKYLSIEKKMQNFSKYVKIPMDYLDLLFWAKQTGKIFK
ncbi:N-glycosylase/DNA lyase [bacterium]|nr:N-glycosylase/DNA lyase [bacterium]